MALSLMPLPCEVWQTILRDPYFELVLIEDKRLATDQANVEARWGCEPITDGYDLETLDMCQTIVPRIIENAKFGMFVGKLVCAKHPRGCGCEALLLLGTKEMPLRGRHDSGHRHLVRQR